MATVAGVAQDLGFGAMKVLWETITNANSDGSPVAASSFAHASVQVTGTFGGATCTIQASNDGSNWVTATDQAGAAVTFTSAGLKHVYTKAAFIRPLLSGGSGSDLDVTLVAVKQNH